MDKNEKERPVEPEILDPEDKIESDLIKKPINEPVPVATRPWRFPFLNRFEKKRIDSYTDVIRSEIGLMSALGDHKKTRSRLCGIDVEIKAERLERELHLDELQREASIKDKKDNLAKRKMDLEDARLDLEFQEIELRKRENERRFRNEERPQDPLEELRKGLSEALQRKKVEDEFEIKAKIQQMETMIKTEDALKEQMAKMYEDMGLADKNPEDYTAEDKEMEDRIYQVYYKIKATL